MGIIPSPSLQSGWTDQVKSWVLYRLCRTKMLFSRKVVSDSLWTHGLQHARLPCPSLSPAVWSNSCPLSQWCHPAISSSVTPSFSCPQSFPASESFPVSQLFTSGGQSIGASASVLPMNIQDWFPLGFTGSICLQSAFFMVQLSHPYMTPGKIKLWLDGPLLAK